MIKTPPTGLHDLVLGNITPGAVITTDRFNPSRRTFEFEISWRNFSYLLSISRERWEDKQYDIIRILSRFSVPYPEVTRGGRKFWVIFHDNDVTVDGDKTIWRYGLVLNLNQDIIEVPVEISGTAHAILDTQAGVRGFDERAFRLGVGLWQIKHAIDRSGKIQKGLSVGIDSANVGGLLMPSQAADQEMREYVSRKVHLAYKGKDAAVHLRFDWIDLGYLGSSEADFNRALSLWTDREWNVNGLVVSPMKPLLERLDKKDITAEKRRAHEDPAERRMIKRSEKGYGKWEILKSLPEGGQAHTFLVRNIGEEIDKQPYVLKRLKNLGRIERFKREIEIGLKLSHHNLVKIVDFDLKAEKPYFVTEYCEGGDLEKRGVGQGLDPLSALRMMTPICHGIAHAHSKGVIHRDINPKNIFLKGPDGIPIVGDFGICHVDEQGRRLTLMEEAVGPRLYISPELEDGRADQVSPRSDVYSLGKLLYWLITGAIFAREKRRGTTI